jgi:hypothetical protein
MPLSTGSQLNFGFSHEDFLRLFFDRIKKFALPDSRTGVCPLLRNVYKVTLSTPEGDHPKWPIQRKCMTWV